MARVGGMMWQWNPKTDLEKAAGEAIAYYERTRGSKPAICYVNESLASQPQEIDGVRICPLSYIAPAHLWLVEEEVHSDREKGDQG